MVSLDSHLRENIRPTSLPNPDPNDKPFYIPAGTKYVLLARFKIVDSFAFFRIVYSVFMMHRRKDLWGSDGKCNQCLLQSSVSPDWPRTHYAAEEFDPDRFLDERVRKYLVTNLFIFLLLSAGPRICLGQQVCSLLIVPYLF